MKCDICGSRKDVRKFYGFLMGKPYKECRECFEKAMRISRLPKETWEMEWARGAVR